MWSERTHDLLGTDIHEARCEDERRHALDHRRRPYDLVPPSKLTDTAADRDSGESPASTDRLSNLFSRGDLPRLDDEGVMEDAESGEEVGLQQSTQEREVSTGDGSTWAEDVRLSRNVALLVVAAVPSEVRAASLGGRTPWTVGALTSMTLPTVSPSRTRGHCDHRRVFG
jgi:hypothetical protein